jgi:hypothetical protein
VQQTDGVLAHDLASLTQLSQVLPECPARPLPVEQDREGRDVYRYVDATQLGREDLGVAPRDRAKTPAIDVRRGSIRQRSLPRSAPPAREEDGVGAWSIRDLAAAELAKGVQIARGGIHRFGLQAALRTRKVEVAEIVHG